jgi:CRP-like cAMP-binding protein
MSENTFQNIPITNKLLAALPAKEYERLLPRLEFFALNFGETLYQPDDIINDVYFPESGVVSLLSTSEGNAKMGVGMVGSEGLVGLPVSLGVSKLRNLAVVHAAGRALKMKSVDLLNICELGGVLPRLLQCYTHLFITQLSQILICTRFHRIESQLVCWLLMAQDRIQSNELPITHGVLSNLLGVRREAVTQTAGKLQQRQLISYRRGSLTILNRAGLEAAACPCYAVIKEEERKFLH